VEVNLNSAKDAIRQQFSEIVLKAIAIDPTLEKSVLAEMAKILQGIEMLESRMIKAEKHKQDSAVQQIRALIQKYFPNGGLQERNENFLPFYAKHGQDFFEALLNVCDPLESGFAVVRC